MMFAQPLSALIGYRQSAVLLKDVAERRLKFQDICNRHKNNGNHVAKKCFKKTKITTDTEFAEPFQGFLSVLCVSVVKFLASCIPAFA